MELLQGVHIAEGGAVVPFHERVDHCADNQQQHCDLKSELGVQAPPFYSPFGHPEHQQDGKPKAAQEYADHHGPEHYRVVAQRVESFGVDDEAGVVERTDGIEQSVPGSSAWALLQKHQSGNEHRCQRGLNHHRADHHSLDQPAGLAEASGGNAFLSDEPGAQPQVASH